MPYYFNLNAWITSIILNNILGKFNNQIKKVKTDRKVFLLIDNASSYGTEHSSQVTVRYLPPNCRSVFQPYDPEIIRFFYENKTFDQTADECTLEKILNCVRSVVYNYVNITKVYGCQSRDSSTSDF